MRPVRSGRAHRVVGLVLVLVSGVAFGSMPIMATVAYRSGAEPVALLAARFAIGAAALAGIRAVHRARRPQVRPGPDRRACTALFLLGAVGYCTQSMSYFSALQHLPAALVSVLLYLYPAMVVAICAVVWRRRPGTTVLCAWPGRWPARRSPWDRCAGPCR